MSRTWGSRNGASRDPHYSITTARPQDVARLPAIELAAARLLTGHAPDGRRGLGTQLVLRVCEWAAGNGCASVTLTTFRDVPWNMPFYARLGFEIVPRVQLSAALSAIVEDETRRGLDPARRVVMRRAVAPGRRKRDGRHEG